jgi:sugar/nucleoside kinase (ribokinase family)
MPSAVGAGATPSAPARGACVRDEVLDIRPAADCRWDCVSFGEVMLRFDPGFGRVRNARSFQVWGGGGEYNVARAMRKCWGKRAAVVTALPDNDLGWLVEDFIMQGGVDASHLIRREFDGLGRNPRVGLNFTEKGFGIRPALGVSDRGHSAASQMLGNEEDFTACLGFEVEGLDEHISAIDPANFKRMIEACTAALPNFKVAATTLRNAKTASVNDWSAILWARGQFYQSILRENLEIYDRVGGGDGFASGLAYGFLEGLGPQAAAEYGAAHGALAMTTPGDTSMVSASEVEAAIKSKGARVIR